MRNDPVILTTLNITKEGSVNLIPGTGIFALYKEKPCPLIVILYVKGQIK